jgi:hypothetical protein
VSPRNYPGIEVRHAPACAGRDGGKCRCDARYKAWVYDATTGKRISKTFPTLAAARVWRADHERMLRDGTLRAPTATTIRQASAQWLEAARAGVIRNRSGDPYKPSALRAYEQALNDHILPALGGHRLSDLRRQDVQYFVDRLVATGAQPSTVRNVLMPLRVIYRRAIQADQIAVNPTTGVQLPAVRGGRDRVATREEAAGLIAVLPREDRALWATAMYAGLRRGELMALRWSDVNLAAGEIRVSRSFDPPSGEMVTPKSRAGRAPSRCPAPSEATCSPASAAPVTISCSAAMTGARLRTAPSASARARRGRCTDTSRSGCTSAATRSLP